MSIGPDSDHIDLKALTDNQLGLLLFSTVQLELASGGNPNAGDSWRDPKAAAIYGRIEAEILRRTEADSAETDRRPKVYVRAATAP